MCPTYNFRNKETGEEFSEFMSMRELDEYLEKNPHTQTIPNAPAIISGRDNLKPDKGFRELLSGIKKKSKTNLNDFGG